MSAAAILSALDRPSASVGRLRSANWQTWAGSGAMPVAAHAQVSVLLRDGSVHKAVAGALCWQWDRAPDGADPEDIVAFRIREDGSRATYRRRGR